MDTHAQISANDKDFKPAFDKMCMLVTRDIHEMGVRTEAFASIYDDDDLKKLSEDEVLETVRDDQWLEDVYGVNSRLENTEWVQRVVKQGKWVFNAKELRDKVF